MPIFFAIYVIFLLIAMISIITNAAKQTKKAARQTVQPRKMVVDQKKSDFSFKFNNHTDEHSHNEQANYQEEYSQSKMTTLELYQIAREKRELARIADPPLSEAERNVIEGH